MGPDNPDRDRNFVVDGKRMAAVSKLSVEPSGRRVVDQAAMGAFGARYSPEVQELLLIGGKQEAQELCGGDVELIAITREPLYPQAASMRWR
jgi:hypothetical protein